MELLLACKLYGLHYPNFIDDNGVCCVHFVTVSSRNPYFTFLRPTWISAALFIVLGRIINIVGPQYSRLTPKMCESSGFYQPTHPEYAKIIPRDRCHHLLGR